MSYFQTIKEEWSSAFRATLQDSSFQEALESNFNIDHYKEILRQIFLHARENPQIQALATVYFRGPQRNSIKKFFRHALSEIGHDQLALADLRTLGVDTDHLEQEVPLPATSALLSFPFYQIQYQNPIGYLGYLFHLEFMPTQYGRSYIEVLQKIGVPMEATRFLKEHIEVDKAHNKLMEQYIDELVVTKADLDAVVYSSAVTADLYVRMLSQAVEHANGFRLRVFDGEMDAPRSRSNLDSRLLPSHSSSH